jgi:hypothetical protein
MYRYTVSIDDLDLFKYEEDDEYIIGFVCFEDFKEAKYHLLEALDVKVQWALNLTARNYKK